MKDYKAVSGVMTDEWRKVAEAAIDQERARACAHCGADPLYQATGADAIAELRAEVERLTAELARLQPKPTPRLRLYSRMRNAGRPAHRVREVTYWMCVAREEAK